MRKPFESTLLLPVLLQLLYYPPLTHSSENLSQCQLPERLVKRCSCDKGVNEISLTCVGLNSTSDLAYLEPSVAKNVIKLYISEGSMPCIDIQSMSAMRKLEDLRVTHSQLREVLCRRSSDDEKLLSHLTTLDLSFNQLTILDESLAMFQRIMALNLSSNQIIHVRPIFAAFKQLKSLDLSNNKLSSNFNKLVLKDLSPSVKFLDITGNPWPCTSHLSWLYRWSLTQPSTVQNQLSRAECTIENSSNNQPSPLLTVMKYYSVKVNPHCPELCSCHFYHFSVLADISPTYTVLVNCSHQNLSMFPSLPQQTTVLDLSHNRLDQHSYNGLDVETQNYLDITSLILSYNKIQSIGDKLLKMKLHRSFKVDHNSLTEIPYDFSLLLQKHDHNQISLGGNPWHCTCNAEITDSSLLDRLQDVLSVMCGDGSVPESIVGRRLMDIDSSVLCPRSEKAEEKERVLQAVCGVLAFLIVITLSKLLYDYWNYTKRGKLPWIVYRMP